MHGSVPRRWAGATIFCLGTGPSLSAHDVSLLQDFPVVAVNSAVDLCPWADVLFAAEKRWWDWNPQWRTPDGAWPLLKRYTCAPELALDPHVTYLHETGTTGLEESPACIRTGGTSGYAAVNIAMHMGARRIVLLGYDMQPAAEGHHHFFGEYPNGSHLAYAARLKLWPGLYEQLRARGIELLNASRVSALPPLIPRVDIHALTV